MFIVECGRGFSRELGRFDVFDCHDSHWTWLLALGSRYGWTPKGTIFSGNHEYPRGIWPKDKQDYAPIGWFAPKVFLADDAAAFAVALESALPDLRAGKIDLAASKPSFALFMDNMTEEQCTQLNTAVRPEKVEELIDFLRRGEFRFAYDD